MAIITGSRRSDYLVGSDEADRINADDGDDVIQGLGGNDQIWGAGGADILMAGAGDDEVTFGDDDITADGGDGADYALMAFTTSRDDLVFSIADNLARSVRLGEVEIRGFEALNLSSGRGHDQIRGGDLTDVVQGGKGNDDLDGRGGRDTLWGEDGLDHLWGGDGDDALYGGSGADWLRPGEGRDIVDGGDGSWDTIAVDRSSATEAIRFSIADSSVMQTLDNGTTVVNVEHARIATGSGDDQLTGAQHGDLFRAGAGNDTVSGRGDRDELHGEDGDDTLAGGEEWDELYGGAGNDSLDGGEDADDLYGGDGDDTLFAGNSDDFLFGDDFDNLRGGNGNDWLYGGDGRDSLEGDGGDDVIFGGRGDSIINGHTGFNQGNLDFADSGKNLVFKVAENLADWVRVDGTTVRNFQQITFHAGDGDDIVYGGDFLDILSGGKGDDRLSGGGGDDWLVGEKGRDDLIGGYGADRLNGDEGKDYLVGGEGDDFLDGGAGKDTANHSGQLSDYRVEQMADGSIRIVDLSEGSRGGADTVRNVELFQFADRTVTLEELLASSINRAPVAVNDAISVSEDAVYTQLHLLANDFDPDAYDVIRIASVDSSGVAGYLGLNDDGTLYYTPPARFQSLSVGQTATQSFTYTIRDAFGRTSTATATITVQGANDAPVAVDDAVTVQANGSLAITPLANDHDPDSGDGLGLNAIVRESGARGSGVAGANNVVLYTPGDAFRFLGEGQVATERFGYGVRDGSGFVDSGMVTVTVVGVNDAPVATGESFTVVKSGASLLGNLLANDSDVDRGDSIRIGESVVTTEKGATVTIDALGRATYDPGNIFDGVEETTDSFTYTVTDRLGATSVATVNLGIRSGTGPTDPGLFFKWDVPEDEAVDLYELLIDEVGAVTIESVNTAGTLGTVIFDRDARQLVFVADHPSLDPLGPDRHMDTTFTYTVRLASGELRTGTVEVEVWGTNDPAVAVDDAIAVEEGQVLDLAALLTANDLDPDGNLFRFRSIDTQGTLGRVEFDPLSGIVRYHADTPELLALEAGETIVDHFSYTISDALDGDNAPTSTATVSVTVTGGETEFLFL